MTFLELGGLAASSPCPGRGLFACAVAGSPLGLFCRTERGMGFCKVQTDSPKERRGRRERGRHCQYTGGNLTSRQNKQDQTQPNTVLPVQSLFYIYMSVSLSYKKKTQKKKQAFNKALFSYASHPKTKLNKNTAFNNMHSPKINSTNKWTFF